jgi:hypothetical protein
MHLWIAMGLYYGLTAYLRIVRETTIVLYSYMFHRKVNYDKSQKKASKLILSVRRAYYSSNERGN